MSSIDNWRMHAACREEDPDLFFPIGSTGPAVVQAEEARTVCRDCPVRAACLEWALEHGQDYTASGAVGPRTSGAP